MKAIWYTLAENALDGKYASNTSSAMSSEIEGRRTYEYDWFDHFMDSNSNEDCFYLLEPEEQCLFLLFCGESYEGN